MADPQGHSAGKEWPLYSAALVTSTAAALALDELAHSTAVRCLRTGGGLLWTSSVRMLSLWVGWKGLQSLWKLWGLLSFRVEPSRVEAPPAGFNLTAISAATRSFVELNHPELFEAMDYGSLTLITPNNPAHPPSTPKGLESHPLSGEEQTSMPEGNEQQRTDQAPQQQQQQQQQAVQRRQRQLPDEIWILGTAHVSRTSALHVKQAILHLRPQAVAVELCNARRMLLLQKDPDEQETVQVSESSTHQTPQGTADSNSKSPPQISTSSADQGASTGSHPTHDSSATHSSDLQSNTEHDPSSSSSTQLPAHPQSTVNVDQSLHGSPSTDHETNNTPPPTRHSLLPSHPLESIVTSMPASEQSSQESSPLYSRPIPTPEFPAAIEAPISPSAPVAQPNILQLVMKARREGQNVMTALLGALMAQCAAQLKTTLGLEFIKAHQAILQLSAEPGCTHPTQLILADVAVDVTLRRSWGVLSRFQKLRVCWYILTGLVFGKIGADDLEELMKEDVMEGAMKELSEKFPTLLGPLLHERNHHMANVVECIAAAGMRQRVVLVCGKAHVAGIVHCLLQR